MHQSSVSEFSESLIGALVSQTLPWSVVEFFLDGIDVMMRYLVEVRASLEILPNKTVEILDPSFLPRAIRVAVIGIDVVVEAEFPVVSALAASVHGEALHGKFFGKVTPRFFGREGALVHHLGEAAELARAFILHAEHRAAVLTDRGIGFPVTERRLSTCFFWSKRDRGDERYRLFLSGFASMSAFARLARTAKILIQSEEASSSFVDECVYGFMRDPLATHPRIWALFDLPSDLLWTPLVLREFEDDILSQLIIGI